MGGCVDPLELMLATHRARGLFRDNQRSVEPEIALVPFLRLLLEVPVAVDVGCCHGEFTDAFAHGGLEVWAYDASPRMAHALTRRLAAWTRVRVMCCAIADHDGLAKLYLADMPEHPTNDADLFSTLSPRGASELVRFPEAITVPVRRLSTLQSLGLAPKQIGFLKVDTEGEDLKVLAGLETLDVDMILVEFWGEDHPFGKGSAQNSPMRYQQFFSSRGYDYMLMFARDASSASFRVRLNDYGHEPAGWGNILFFKERDVALRAARACLDIFGPEVMGA